MRQQTHLTVKIEKKNTWSHSHIGQLIQGFIILMHLNLRLWFAFSFFTKSLRRKKARSQQIILIEEEKSLLVSLHAITTYLYLLVDHRCSALLLLAIMIITINQ